MTLIVTSRFGEKAVYIYDIRVTHSGTQSDDILKWLKWNNRLGLLIAGPVAFWKDIRKLIDGVIHKININNVLEEDGPLRQAVIDVSIKYTSSAYNRAGAIGFLIDTTNDQNRQFSIDVKLGLGANLEEIPDGTSKILGSGQSIPSIYQRLTHAATRCHDIYPEDLYLSGNCIRNEIQACAQAAGPGSFVRLGVSSFMMLALLDGSCFKIPGEESLGGKSLNGVWTETKYSIALDDDKILIRDEANRTTHEIRSLDKLGKTFSGTTIDPERREIGFDVTEVFPGQNVVYKLQQGFIRGFCKGDFSKKADLSIFAKTFSLQESEFALHDYIYRSFTRIDVNDLGLCKERKLAHTVITLNDDDASRQSVLSGDFHFLLEDINEDELVTSKLFDHEWLSENIQGYRDVFSGSISVNTA